mgnify:CR=1 FL=1
MWKCVIIHVFTWFYTWLGFLKTLKQYDNIFFVRHIFHNTWNFGEVIQNNVYCTRFEHILIIIMCFFKQVGWKQFSNLNFFKILFLHEMEESRKNQICDRQNRYYRHSCIGKNYRKSAKVHWLWGATYPLIIWKSENGNFTT